MQQQHSIRVALALFADHCGVCVRTVQGTYWFKDKLLALLCQHNRTTKEQLANLSVVMLPVIIAVGGSFCSAQAV